MKMTPAFIRQVQEQATLLRSEAEIMTALDRMADEMRPVLADKNPVFLSVMNGGLMTMAELAKRLNFPMQMEYIHVSRYAGETTGGTSMHWRCEPPADLLHDRHVVIVDDILDGGVTLAAIVEYCEGNGVKGMHTAVLLDKTDARVEDGLQSADFTGLSIENRYVFGFGLDYHDYLRNVPAIYAVADEHMI